MHLLIPAVELVPSGPEPVLAVVEVNLDLVSVLGDLHTLFNAVRDDRLRSLALVWGSPGFVRGDAAFLAATRYVQNSASLRTTEGGAAMTVDGVQPLAQICAGLVAAATPRGVHFEAEHLEALDGRTEGASTLYSQELSWEDVNALCRRYKPA